MRRRNRHRFIALFALVCQIVAGPTFAGIGAHTAMAQVDAGIEQPCHETTDRSPAGQDTATQGDHHPCGCDGGSCHCPGASALALSSSMTALASAAVPIRVSACYQAPHPSARDSRVFRPPI